MSGKATDLPKGAGSMLRLRADRGSLTPWLSLQAERKHCGRRAAPGCLLGGGFPSLKCGIFTYKTRADSLRGCHRVQIRLPTKTPRPCKMYFI